MQLIALYCILFRRSPLGPGYIAHLSSEGSITAIGIHGFDKNSRGKEKLLRNVKDPKDKLNYISKFVEHLSNKKSVGVSNLTARIKRKVNFSLLWCS